jgi:hypothetical protein
LGFFICHNLLLPLPPEIHLQLTYLGCNTGTRNLLGHEIIPIFDATGGDSGKHFNLRVSGILIMVSLDD